MVDPVSPLGSFVPPEGGVAVGAPDFMVSNYDVVFADNVSVIVYSFSYCLFALSCMSRLCTHSTTLIIYVYICDQYTYIYIQSLRAFRRAVPMETRLSLRALSSVFIDSVCRSLQL